MSDEPPESFIEKLDLPEDDQEFYNNSIRRALESLRSDLNNLIDEWSKLGDDPRLIQLAVQFRQVVNNYELSNWIVQYQRRNIERLQARIEELEGGKDD